MTEHDALLAAVLEQPDEDLPRQIYADWLEEQGDEAQRGRAEFIRTQLLLADLPRDNERRPELEALERRLRKKHERVWLGRLREHLHAWQYQRGFIEYVALDADRFLVQQAALFQAHPIRGLHLHNARDRALKQVARCTFLAQLHTLDLSNNPLGAENVRDLLLSPYLAGLYTLRFNDNPLGFDAVRAVVDSPELAHLTTLELRRNNLTDDTALFLTESPYLVRLLNLDLRGNAISERGRTRLRAMFEGGQVRF